MTEVRRDVEESSLGSPEALDDHIASLITRLENLLGERAQCLPDRPLQEGATGANLTPLSMFHRDQPPVRPTGFPDGRAAMAREVIRWRRLRSDLLPAGLFAEPAWDMLLDLYAAHYERKSVCVSSLCIAANVPSTTALRSIEMMTEQGCVVRQRDPSDGRRIFIALSDTARASLDAWFAAIAR